MTRPAAAPRAGAGDLARPVLFVTNHVPPDRAGAFAQLHAREGLELLLFGGRSHHATAGLDDPGVPFRRVRQREVFGAAASGRHRAVVCGTAGRVALPAAWRGARRAGVPFLLWSALWAELVTPAHLAAWPLMAAVYRDADAVVAYGEHVAGFARRHGARAVVVAPQAVDGAWWSAPADGAALRLAAFQALFVGRPAPEKGLRVLLEAWGRAGLPARSSALVLVGPDTAPPAVDGAATPPVVPFGAGGSMSAAELRDVYAASDVLVVPSLPTRAFREPWGLVINEAMHGRTAIVASDAVGAAAGGLVRDGETGLVVPAGDAAALAGALRRLHDDPALRARLAEAGADAVSGHTFAAWAEGFSAALAVAGVARAAC
jgi:glycosyltransferase involved in cell wall biosynthesis